MKAFLVLEDGTVFEGVHFGASGEVMGTVVFNTGVVGYEGILTDPASRGQIIVMTYPLIGNYGVNQADLESETCHGVALLVREKSRITSNFRSEGNLDDFMAQHGVIGISDIDTRALALHIREKGEMRGIIISGNSLSDQAGARQTGSASLSDIAELISRVRSYDPSSLESGKGRSNDPGGSYKVEYQGNGAGVEKEGAASHATRVVLIDLGVRRSSLRQLEKSDCFVIRVPAGTRASDILDMEPDGIFISSGPEDEGLIEGVAREVRPLLGVKPIFGVGTGHLVLGHALGARICRMKCGHHGANHAVRKVETGKLEITLQNHSHVLDEDTLPAGEVEITWRHLVDGTIEGISVREKRAFSVQYIPTAMEAGTISREFQEFKELCGLRRERNS